MLKVELRSPCFGALSKRLKKLNIKRPFYRNNLSSGKEIKAIALDSSGLKCYGHDEWQSERYGLSTKKRWSKLHLVLDNQHIIQTSDFSDRFTQDANVVEDSFNRWIKE